MSKHGKTRWNTVKSAALLNSCKELFEEIHREDKWSAQRPDSLRMPRAASWWLLWHTMSTSSYTSLWHGSALHTWIAWAMSWGNSTVPRELSFMVFLGWRAARQIQKGVTRADECRIYIYMCVYIYIRLSKKYKHMASVSMFRCLKLSNCLPDQPIAL
jgi:hypothetical protein